MSHTQAPAALAQLEALKRDYRVRMLDVIEALSEKLRRGVSRDELAEVESTLHKLAGSGGSFGFAQLSVEARRLELSVRSQRKRPDPKFDTGAWATAVAALSEHLSETASEGGTTALPVAAAEMGNQVYLLEPEQPQAERIAGTLLQFGHAVSTFNNADEMVDAIEKMAPRAVLIDLDFGDGGEESARRVFDTVQHLRESLRLPNCAVFYLSRTDSMSRRLAAARAGATGFFVKPVDPMHLVDRLDLLYQQQQAPRYRVMLVDDDPLLVRHHAAVLEAGGFDVEIVENPQTALERMEEFRPDLVLLDLYMPGCSGPELARVIRMHGQWLAVPIVFLSAETDMEMQLSAASEGADDFLTKPIRDAHLVAAVRTRCERSHQMSVLINRDSLTGLLKHSRIKEALVNEINRSQRQPEIVSVAMLDIDHFKRINDSYGHPVGDQVIRALANLLRQRVRTSDRAGRYGGEEFMLVLPNCDEECALSLLEDICKRFKALRFSAQGEEFQVKLSAGIASSKHFDSAAELVAHADQALYSAKRNGRDRIEIARAPVQGQQKRP